MTTLKKNIDHYMKIANIETYFELLKRIGEELGEKNSYKFAENERINFSKALNGKRPLKREFIIPLETIFGVSLARLMNEKDFNEPDIADLPFLKGIRYYAYKDDPKLYEEEFNKIMFLDDGHFILINQDEFGKTFLDYVVEYRAINAIKFLSKRYKFRNQRLNENMFEVEYKSIIEYIFCKHGDELALLLIENGEADLLYKIFDINNEFFTFHLDYPNNIFSKENVINGLLENDALFNSLFNHFLTPFKKLNRHVVVFDGEKVEDDDTIERINPLINICLKYALKNEDKYKKQIKSILKQGFVYNNEVISKLNSLDMISNRFPSVDEYGNVFIDRGILYSNLVYVDQETINKVNDNEIKNLINQLPSIQ